MSSFAKIRSPNDENRLCVPESTLRPAAPKPKSGELTDFLSDDVERASQGSKGSKGASQQPTQDSMRMSQPTQVSPKEKKKADAEEVFSDTDTWDPKPFSGANMSTTFAPTKPQAKRHVQSLLGFGGAKRQKSVPEPSSGSSSSDSSASDDYATSDGGSESEGAKKRRRKKEAKKKKAAKKKAKADKKKKEKKAATPKKTKKSKAEEQKEEIKLWIK